MDAKLDANYLIEFPDVLNQVLSEAFNEPKMVAGVHASALFGSDMIAMAAIAGSATGLDTMEAVAALAYLQWLTLKHGKARWRRFMPGPARTRYADLKRLCERTFGLIKHHFRPGGKGEAFTAEMMSQMKQL